MRYLILSLLSLLGSASWAQSSGLPLEEPPQSLVFHVEGGDPRKLTQVAADLPRRFPAVESALPCERGGYLVILPRQPLPQGQYEALQAAITDELHRQGFRSYYKAGASVVELAQTCDQLLKPLLQR